MEYSVKEQSTPFTSDCPGEKKLEIVFCGTYCLDWDAVGGAMGIGQSGFFWVVQTHSLYSLY